MSIDRVIDLSVKKLSDSITRDEQTELDALISESGKLKKVHEEAVSTWEKSGKYVPKVAADAEASWSAFQGRIHQKPQAKVFMLSPFYKVAAAIVIAVGLGVSIFNPWESERYVTEAGEMLEVTLADQSVITLNENSSLTVSRTFNEDLRSVDFVGEAYFDIAENPEKPFIIQSRSSEIKVLGTSFNVDAREELEAVEVDVTSGRVSLSEIGNQSNQVILTKGMKGTYAFATKELNSTDFENQNFQAWRTNLLEFDDLSMSRVLEDIEEYFGEEVSTSNPEILACNFTSTFSDPSINEVLDILSLTLDLSYKKERNEYVLSGKGCTEIEN